MPVQETLDSQDTIQPDAESPRAVSTQDEKKLTIREQRPRGFRQLIRESLWMLDLLVSPLVLVASLLLRQVRKANLEWLPFSKKIFDSVGIYPIQNHYYEPYIDQQTLSKTIDLPRDLPGVDLNDDLQLKILDKFHYNDELLQIPMQPTGKREYYYASSMFGTPDSEYLYNFVRWSKPRKIIEIGSGMSTLMTINAIKQNKLEDPSYECEHTCIEPYEVDWLESTGVNVIRKKVEDLDPAIVEDLDANDLLFIDSSHIIRHHGDVLVEFLSLLPRLKPGVFAHVHDIFTPYNYPADWIINKRLFWNEQYLLEAFLTLNKQFEVVGALHYLSRHYPELLKAKCPNMDESCLGTSFYMVRSA